MTEDLFSNLPPMLSPRLRWMQRHHITVDHSVSSVAEAWMAACKEPGQVTQSFVSRQSEHDALCGLAKKLGIRMWNEL